MTKEILVQQVSLDQKEQLVQLGRQVKEVYVGQMELVDQEVKMSVFVLRYYST